MRGLKESPQGVLRGSSTTRRQRKLVSDSCLNNLQGSAELKHAMLHSSPVGKAKESGLWGFSGTGEMH